MPNLSPETRAEWRREAQASIPPPSFSAREIMEAEIGRRILALLNALEEAEAKLAVRRAELGDLGPVEFDMDEEPSP